MAFEFEQKVLFKHCDPAGIVFYPRYFEMLNDCVEAFFDKVIDWPFEELLKNGGIPTANISTKFTAPSRHGDILLFKLQIERLGRTSLELMTIADCCGEQRLISRSRLVRVDQMGCPSAWPEIARSKLENITEGQHVK